MPRGRGLWPLVGLLLAACGCAGSPAFERPDLGGQRARREAEAIRQFDAQRDRAQWLAARRAWEQGNAQACEDSLSGLLARRPDHREAALLWVELQVLQDHLDLAEETLARLKAEAPDDPAVEEASQLVAAARQAASDAGPLLAVDEPEEETSPAEALPGAVPWDDAPPAEVLASDEPPLPAPPVPDDAPTSVRVIENQPAIRLTEGRGRREVAQPLPDDTDTDADAETPQEEAPSPLTLERRGPRGADSSPETAGSAPEASQLAAAELARAEELLAAGDEDGARTRVETLLRDVPDQATVATAAGAWALKQERPDWALAWLEPRRKQFYRSAGVQRVLGLAYLRSDRAAEAETCLRRALRLDTSSALTYFLLGSCLERLGRTEAAERHFHQAARLDPRYSVRR